MGDEANGGITAAGIKDGTEIAKNLFDIGKAIFIVVVVYMLIFNDALLAGILDKAKASKISIGGITVERQAVEQSVAESSDALQQNAAALRSAQRELGALRASYDSTAEALRASQAALQELQQRSPAGAVPSASAAASRVLAQRALSGGQTTLDSLSQTRVQLEQAAKSTAGAISVLPRGATGGDRFAIVFGADRPRDQANDQLALAQRLRAGELLLFRRQGLFRSAALFATRAEANRHLPAFRALNRYAADAYVVDLATWCPGVEPTGEVVDCGL